MKRRFLSTPIRPQTEPQVPSFPPLPDLPVLSIHYEDERYYSQAESLGLYVGRSSKFFDPTLRTDTTEDPSLAAIAGLLKFDLAAASIRSAQGAYFGMIVHAMGNKASVYDQLAINTAYRLALQPGMNDKLPANDTFFEQVMSELSTHARKYYTSKRSKLSFKGKDVMVNQLVAELNDEVFRLVKELDAQTSVPARSRRSITPVETDMTTPEPRMKLEGSITPADLAKEFNMTPQKLRKLLRSLYEKNETLAHGMRQRWLWHPEHDAEELKIIRKALAK